MEYQKLYGMLYDRSIHISNTNRISAYDELSERFIHFYIQRTCLSIEEFNNMHGLHFEKDLSDFNIDHLISLCEYIYNMLMAYQGAQGSIGYGYMSTMPAPINVQFYMMQINQVIERIGYMYVSEDGVTIFVEKSLAAITVAESLLIPENLSYQLISYHHYAMKGNLDAKKAVLLQLASILEAKRGIKKELVRYWKMLFFIYSII